MEFNASKKYINILFDHIFDLLFIHDFGVNHAEHIFIHILDLLKNDTHLKKWFIELVQYNLLKDEQDMTNFQSRPNWFIDPDLILFIAHATKWKEFQYIAEKRKSESNKIKTLNNNRDFSNELINALGSNWEDRDFYKKFS